MGSVKARVEAPRVRIGGVFLDEVSTRLQYPHDMRSVASLLMPANRHRMERDGEAVVLRLPSITALQLYHDGVLVRERPVADQPPEHEPDWARVRGGSKWGRG